MGHERVGYLPKTKRWRDLVGIIGQIDMSDAEIANVSNRTLANVRQRYQQMPYDTGILAAFKFLVSLVVSSRDPNPLTNLSEHGIEIQGSPGPLELTRAAHECVDHNRSSFEYGSMAQCAVGDTIAIWSERQTSGQQRLFEFVDEPFAIWRKAADGAGFCEISRIFFSKLTERYLNYFLEREASSVIQSLSQRQRFKEGLRTHVDSVSKHAFETAKITQSFAAGWFNRYGREKIPSDRLIESFLRLAFGKMAEELRREEGAKWPQTLKS